MSRLAAACAAAALVLAEAGAAVAQPVPGAVAIEPPPAEPAAWEVSASAFGYVVPEERDYGSATVTADLGIWHLEARYNYEGLDTGSFWAGANFAFGETVAFEVTPMVGGVVGHTHGVAPGYHLTVRWKRLELYSEGEYLFDTDTRPHDDSFFYSWNELTYAPWDWLQAGLVSQRTRAYQTPLDVQRGILVRGFVRNWTAGFYVFNFGWTDPTFVFSLGLDF